jgi:hypothetical protein
MSRRVTWIQVNKPQIGGPVHLIKGLENDIIGEISVQRAKSAAP